MTLPNTLQTKVMMKKSLGRPAVPTHIPPQGIRLNRCTNPNIWNFLDAQVDKHLNWRELKRHILDEDNKNLYFMWGKIKREYPKGDTFAWPAKEAASKCK